MNGMVIEALEAPKQLAACAFYEPRANTAATLRRLCQNTNERAMEPLVVVVVVGWHFLFAFNMSSVTRLLHQREILFRH